MKACLYLLLIILALGSATAVSAASDSNSKTTGDSVNTDKSTQQSRETPSSSDTVVTGESLTAIKKPSIKRKSPPQETTLLPQLFQVTLGLLFVLLLIVALAWLFRRFGQQQLSIKGNIRIVGGVHLSAREKVVLLQVGNQQILLGVAPGRINKLHLLEEPLELQQDSPVSSAFSERLAQLLQGKIK